MQKANLSRITEETLHTTMNKDTNRLSPRGLENMMNSEKKVLHTLNSTDTAEFLALKQEESSEMSNPVGLRQSSNQIMIDGEDDEEDDLF